MCCKIMVCINQNGTDILSVLSVSRVSIHEALFRWSTTVASPLEWPCWDQSTSAWVGSGEELGQSSPSFTWSAAWHSGRSVPLLLSGLLSTILHLLSSLSGGPASLWWRVATGDSSFTESRSVHPVLTASPPILEFTQGEPLLYYMCIRCGCIPTSLHGPEESQPRYFVLNTPMKV